jgi:hypothetical protein
MLVQDDVDTGHLGNIVRKADGHVGRAAHKASHSRPGKALSGTNGTAGPISVF